MIIQHRSAFFKPVIENRKKIVENPDWICYNKQVMLFMAKGDPYMLWLYILIAVSALLIVVGVPTVIMLKITVPIARKVYSSRLTRDEDGKWGRVCSDTTSEEQVAMWNEGCRWADANKDRMTEHQIVNDSLKLCGEYYDFGGDSCVIILPGRCESLMYSYYFAPSYAESGVNVLVIDTRAHGLSEGVYNSIGVYESGDVRAWISYISERFGIKRFYLHAICIGSAAAIKAMTDDDPPACVEGIICEGCFTTFRETFKEHMKADNRPLFPVLDLVMHYLKKNAKADTAKYAPIRMVPKLRCRILFMAGKKDVFSLPPKTEQLFAACNSPEKELVWFDKGGHSHLRINNTEKYDDTVKNFINSGRQ